MRIDSSNSASGGWSVDAKAAIYTPTFPTTITEPHDWRVFADAVNLCTAIYERVEVLRYAHLSTAPGRPAIPALNTENICKRSWLLNMQTVFTTEAVYGRVLDSGGGTGNDFQSMATAATAAGMSAFEYFCKEIAGLEDSETGEWGFRFSNTIDEDTGQRVVEYPSSSRVVAVDDYLHPANMEDLITAAKALTTFIMADGWAWFEETTSYSETSAETDPAAFNGNIDPARNAVVAHAVSEFGGVASAAGSPGAYFEVQLHYDMTETETTYEGTGYGWGKSALIGAPVPYDGDVDFYIHVAANGDDFMPMGSGLSTGWNLIDVDESITSAESPDSVYGEAIGLVTPAITPSSFVLDMDPPELICEAEVELDPANGDTYGNIVYIDITMEATVYIGEGDDRLNVTDNDVVDVHWYSVDGEAETHESEDNPLEMSENMDGVYTFRAKAIAFEGADLESDDRDAGDPADGDPAASDVEFELFY